VKSGYREATTRLYECHVCGAVGGDTARHTRWHKEQAKK
jgi:hypothetical protein